MIEWLTTLPNPRVVSHTADAGQRGWKTHAVDSPKQSFGEIRYRRAACGLRPGHGWSIDMFIEDKCSNCQRVLNARAKGGGS